MSRRASKLAEAKTRAPPAPTGEGDSSSITMEEDDSPSLSLEILSSALSDAGIEGLAEKLGVLSLEDFQFVTRSDVEGVLAKPVQRRKALMILNDFDVELLSPKVNSFQEEARASQSSSTALRPKVSFE